MRFWCVGGAYNWSVAAKLRKLSPDAELFRRRAAGEPLRELAADYGVSHTSLSRYFARADARRELKRAEQLNRAEQRADEARWQAELRAQEARWRAERQAEREAHRRLKAEERTGSVSAAEPVADPDASERGSRPGAVEGGRSTRRRGSPGSGRIGRVRAGETYTYADWLDERDARVPLTRADLESEADRVAAKAVEAGGGIEAVIEATGFRTRENVFRNIDPAILERAQQNDAAQTSADETALPG